MSKQVPPRRGKARKKAPSIWQAALLEYLNSRLGTKFISVMAAAEWLRENPDHPINKEHIRYMILSEPSESNQ